MSTALKLMTVEEFLPWAEGKEGRWELHDGVPVMVSSAEPAMMSPERDIRTKFCAAKALDGAVATGDLSHEVFADGMAVRLDARTTFDPDASGTAALGFQPTLSRSTIPSSWSKSCLPVQPPSITAASSAAISRFQVCSII
jgi:hypothetical protein